MSAPEEFATTGGRTRELADGHHLPLLGLGVWQMADGPECVDAVRAALELGYRHLDTAQGYRNESSVGRALKQSGVPREEVYLTTKFFPGSQDPVREAEASLRRLDVDYVDLYLVHWPQGSATRAWPGMERAHELGYARSIGVSNFDAGEMDQVLATSSVAPVVNQIQFNPSAYRRQLLAACEERDTVLEAYSPLGTGSLLKNKTVREVADRLGATPAQVLLQWCLGRDVPVIAKSTSRARLAENAASFGVELSPDDLDRLDALDRTGGTGESLSGKWW